MAKWMKFQLNSGKNDNGQDVVPQAFLKKTHDPVVIADDLLYYIVKKPSMPVTDSMDKYALGWFTGYYRGKNFSLVFLL